MIEGFISSLVAMTVVATVAFVPTTAATSTELTDTFSKPVKMKKIELSAAHATSVPAHSEIGYGMGFVSPDIQSPNWSYSAHGGVTTTAFSVQGNYDSSNYTFSFHNVSKGTYKLRIRNLTGFDLAGNGFVFYY